MRKRVATETERECLALEKIEPMQDKVGQELDGRVSAVLRYGMSVEPTQGLRGRYSGRRRRIGDPVRVRLAAAHAAQRRIDLVVVSGSLLSGRHGHPAPARGRRHLGSKRRRSRRRARGLDLASSVLHVSSLL